MSNEAVGSASIFALKKNPSAWGTGAAIVLGAGNQIEVEGESFTADSQLIPNMGLNGQGTQLPGVKGNELHSGSLGPIPVYFRGAERVLAPVLGTAGIPAQQNGELAYKHSLRQAATAPYNYTIIGQSAPAIREWPHVRLNGFEFSIEDGQYGKLTLPGIPSQCNYNVGSPITNRLVVSVAVANVTFTIANQPTEPSPFTLTITDGDTSITEFWVTVTGTDRDDNYQQVVYKKSVSGLTYTSTEYFKTVTSIIGSNLAGSAAGDTIVVGVSNGVNNNTTVGSITLPSTTELNLAIFAQGTLLINDQTAGALSVSTDEIFISKFSLKVDRHHEGKVTTKLGNRSDEPIQNDFFEVTGGFSLPDWNTEDHVLLKNYLFGKTKKKMSFSLDGPLVTATVFSQLKFWLQNCQFSKGSVNVSGPGRTPLDIEFKAHRALAAGTGMPDASAIAVDVICGASADPLA